MVQSWAPDSAEKRLKARFCIYLTANEKPIGLGGEGHFPHSENHVALIDQNDRGQSGVGGMGKYLQLRIMSGNVIISTFGCCDETAIR